MDSEIIYFKYQPSEEERIIKFDGKKLNIPPESNLVALCLSEETISVYYKKVSDSNDPSTQIEGYGTQSFSAEKASLLEIKLNNFGQRLN